MNETQNIQQCRVTSNYSIFSFLDGNRSIKDGRVAKIKRSIEMVGYIPSPIVVNEKFQIIDGQGRFAALKELGLPVCYIVIPGLSVEHCVAMNINQTNWTLTELFRLQLLRRETWRKLTKLLSEAEDLPSLPKDLKQQTKF